MTKAEAKNELAAIGAVNEIRTTTDGEKSGWWIDDVWLGTSPVQAVRAIKGNG